MKPLQIVYTACAVAAVVTFMSLGIILHTPPDFVMEDTDDNDATPKEVNYGRVLAYSFLFGLVGMAMVFVYCEVIDPDVRIPASR